MPAGQNIMMSSADDNNASFLPKGFLSVHGEGCDKHYERYTEHEAKD
jgi:hypothetical protein